MTAAGDVLREDDAWSDEEPYRLKHLGDDRVVVEFAPICDQIRTRDREDELGDLVGSGKAVVCDLSATEHIGTDWLRWLSRLSARARQEGTTFVLIGVSEENTAKADLIGLAGEFTLAATVEEGWDQ